MILVLFVASRLLVAGAAFLFWHYLPHAPVKPGDPGLFPVQRFADLFRRADANHFATLIERGYYYDRDSTSGKLSSNVGFYPAYPLTVSLVRASGLVQDTALAGHLVSNLCLLTATFLLWSLAALELNSASGAGWAVAFALFSPGGAWFSMLFSESLFLLTLVGYLVAIRREHWWAAIIVGFVLALTRTIGMLAVLFAGWEIVRQSWPQPNAGVAVRQSLRLSGWMLRGLAVAAPVIGYLALKIYFWHQFGDWSAQRHTLEANWPANATFSTPWAAIAREWAPMHNSKRVIIYGLLTAALALLAFTHRATARWSYTLLGAAMIGICLVASYHSPMARYLSVVVPLHLTLGWIAAQHHLVASACLLGASALMMVLLTGLMVNGYVFY